ncbi:Ubiquinol-cytochrome c reductase complex chaperone CBP3 like protein, partial [Habropoda laboriosa]
KTPLSSTLKYITKCKFINATGIDFSIRSQFRQFCKNVRVKDVPKDLNTPKIQSGIFKKLSHRYDLYIKKYVSYHLYGDIPDQLNYSVFFKGFNMPDTFYSWFLITELHVWLLMVRFMAEGERGKIVIKNIVEAMWHDVVLRADLLGPIPGKVKRKTITELSHQFNAALIGYDEGIMSDDKVLAGALWRRFFRLECNNPEHLETLVIYVRKQTNIFDKIPSDKVFHRSIAQWVDLQSIK